MVEISFFFLSGISKTVPLNSRLQAVTNRVVEFYVDNHLPTLSLEHLSLSLKSNIALHFFLTKPYTLST
jgi:hypothetical protein